MLQQSRALLRSRKRKLPSSLVSLHAPATRHSWGNLGAMRPEEKKEILHGSWREAKPVVLTTVTGDRDCGGFTEPVAFANDEEAAAFLEQESRDDEIDQRIPTLQLARNFFEDLAATADEEVDINCSGEVTPTTDTDRRDEERDVNRQFFADYYIQNGLIEESQRYDFVDCMLRPATALFQINAEKALIRLTTRNQLETHIRGDDSSGSVFQASELDPLTFEVQLMPTQPLGAALRVPYDASTSVISQREKQGSLEANSDDPLLISADMLQSMMTGDSCDETAATVSATDMNQGEVSSQLAEVSHMSNLELIPSPRAPAARPPSVDHLHWLQRNVATGALTTVDLLSLMLPIIAVSAAVSRTKYSSPCTPPIIATLCDTASSATWQAYHRDVVQYVYTKGEESCGDDERSLLGSLIIVAVILGRLQPVKPGSCLVQKQQIESSIHTDDVCSSSALSIPLGDRAPNVVFLQSTRRRLPRDSGLQGSCDVVLCVPRTSDDGIRARVLLGAAGEDEEEQAIPNRFVSLCSAVNDNFLRLCKQLREAVRCVASAGGILVYATHSMNPIENEAVVCAVLTQLKSITGHTEVACVPLLSPLITDALAPEELDGWRRCLSMGASGLASWSALEGGAPEQEVERCDSQVVQEVSEAAWRSSPMISGCDGCFIVVLRVTSKVVPLLSSCPATEREPLPVHTVSNGLLVISGASVDGVVAVTPAAWEWCTHRFSCALVGNDDPTMLKKNSMLVRVGYPVGCVQGGDFAKEMYTKVAFSSALSGSNTATKLRAQVPMGVTVLSMRLPILCELLRLRKLSSKMLRWRLRAIRKQCGDQGPTTEEEREIKDFLSSVASLPNATQIDGSGDLNAPHRSRTVFISPVLPHNACSDGRVLHSAVEEELQALNVVAQLFFEEESTHFTLQLQVPQGQPGATEHNKALTEACVGIRDALLYIHRQMGYFSTLELGVARGSDANERRSVSHPHTGDIVQLADDEYEVEASSDPFAANTPEKSLLSHKEQQRRQRKLRWLQGSIRRNGGVVEKETSNDWVHELSYRKAHPLLGRRII